MKGLLVASVALLLSGCAATRPVTLSYPPTDEQDVLSEPVAQRVASSPATALVLEVFDARSEQSRLAATGSWLNPDALEYVAKNDVQAWVREAFELELTKADVTVTVQEMFDGTALPHLTVDIQRLTCNPGWAYDADVWLQVTLEHPGEAPIVRQYQGRGSAGLNLAGTADAVGKSLALALRDAIGQMRAEIDIAGRR